MNNPYVSIVVPFLNADRTLSKCIQSILAQTRKDWELILVDDGSTDESADICLKYTESDKRIKLLKRPHEGVGPARNAAIEIAQGEKLCFVDADDTVEPDYLEGLCSHPEVDLVVCGYYIDRYDKEGNLVSSESHCPKELTIRSEQEKYLLEEVFMSGIMHINCNKLFTLSIIRDNEIKYNRYKVNEDFIFILEYLLRSQSVMFVNKALYHWIHVNGQQTALSILPPNVLEIYEHSHRLLAKYLKNDTVADKILYRTYDMLIHRYLDMYKYGKIKWVECKKKLNVIHDSTLSKNSFNAYTPQSLAELIMYTLNKKGMFFMAYLWKRMITIFK